MRLNLTAMVFDPRHLRCALPAARTLTAAVAIRSSYIQGSSNLFAVIDDHKRPASTFPCTIYDNLQRLHFNLRS